MVDEDSKNRFKHVMVFHDCISFTLQSMNSAPQVEVQSLRNALDTARRGVEMLEKAIVEYETRRQN